MCVVISATHNDQGLRSVSVRFHSYKLACSGSRQSSIQQQHYHYQHLSLSPSTLYPLSLSLSLSSSLTRLLSTRLTTSPLVTSLLSSPVLLVSFLERLVRDALLDTNECTARMGPATRGYRAASPAARSPRGPVAYRRIPLVER